MVNKEKLKSLLNALLKQPHRKLYPKYESDTEFLERLLKWLYKNNFECESQRLMKELESET